MRSLRLAAFAGVVLLLFISSVWAAPPPTEAGKFVQDLADKVLVIFNDPRLSRTDKEKRLYPLAVGAFDVPRTARFVLGRFWKDASAEQREEFTKAFEHYMVHIYTGQFDLYHDVEFQTVQVRSQETRTLVRTKIIRHDGGPPVAVDWWVTKEGDRFRIIDVNVESVSQLVALREQFAEVIDHEGSIAALIGHMREKTRD